MQASSNASGNTLYLRQEMRTAVDERQDAKVIFDKSYFEHAAEGLNARPYQSFPTPKAATDTIPYTDYFIFKVTVSKEQGSSPKIRIKDIDGLFYSTNKGEVKYVENPAKGK
ncbi:MAG: hypothetical protein JSR37_00970 [Verrucomicrobia bacterium]|nr:hypothetical protein [Verrucomicrobiota bacterium]MBS0637943.1 hypothetical protein [Verrucomicrobiota bacterium]